MSMVKHSNEWTHRRISLSHRKPEWIRSNLDFDALSKRLITVSQEFGLRKAVSSRSLTGETRTFAEILDQQVEKIVLFFLSQQGDLAKKVWLMREKTFQALQGHPLTSDEIEFFCQKYRDLSEEVLDLLAYLELNLVGLRKILKKHDRLYDLKILNLYFDSRLANSKNSQMKQLYHQEGLRAIIGTIRRGFEELYEAKEALFGDDPWDEDGANSNYFQGPSSGHGVKNIASRHSPTRIPRVPFKSRLATFSSQALSTIAESMLSNSDEVRLRGSSKKLQQSNSSKGTSLVDSGGFFRSPSDPSLTEYFTITVGQAKISKPLADIEPILGKINAAADRVLQTQSRTTQEYLASHSSIGLYVAESNARGAEDDDSDDDFSDKPKDDIQTSPFGLFMNLYITFLYQANQYVVAPTASRYATHLGLSASTNGIIIGISPFAALCSALVFSAWSNYSFKEPLICSLVCLTLGNLLYGMALQCDAPVLLFAGRLIGGLGGPRGVARRYIADYVSVKDRTMASSQFVTAGAMGLAFGPLISSLVTRSGISYTLVLGGITIIRFEEETAPGWIMFILFGSCLVLLLIYFEDPRNFRMLRSSSATSTFFAKLFTGKGTSSLKGSHRDSGAHLQNNFADEEDEELPMIQSVIVAVDDFDLQPDDISPNYHRSAVQNKETESSVISLQSDQVRPDTIVDDSLIESLFPKNSPKPDMKFGPKDSMKLSHNRHTPSSHIFEDPVHLDSVQNCETQAQERSSSALLTPAKSVIERQMPERSRLVIPSHGPAYDYGSVSVSPPEVPHLSSSSSTTRTEKVHTHAKTQIPSFKTFPRQLPPRHPIDPESPGNGNGGGFKPCFAHVSVEVAVILLIYLANKVGQEMVVSSAPTICSLVFNWEADSVGLFMAALGLVVLPANIMVSRIAADAEDRAIIILFCYLSIASLVFILNTSIIPYSLFQYLLGASLLFACLNVLEGVIMSLLSKLVSPELAKGTFNSGLLSTEAGTLGRVLGDMTITAFGVADNAPVLLVNLLFTPVAVGLLISLLITYTYYDTFV